MVLWHIGETGICWKWSTAKVTAESGKLLEGEERVGGAVRTAMPNNDGNRNHFPLHRSNVG